MLVTLLIIPVLVSTVFAAPGPKIIEGLWQITTEMNMPAVPGMPKLGSTQKTQTQCITNKNLIPDLSKQSRQDCKTLRTTISGDTVTWVIECNNNGTVTKGKGRITYEKDTMNGTATMSITSPLNKAERIEMTTRITGRRVGDCK